MAQSSWSVACSFFAGLATIAWCAACLPGCNPDGPPPGDEGLAIVLVDTGEILLTDAHLEAYDWDTHRLLLAPSGVDRWESFAVWDTTHTPPVRKLGALTGREFSLRIDGIEMYRGHCWSLAMSMMRSGVLLYDTIGAAPDRSLRLGFERLVDETAADPRGRPEIEACLRTRGKLRSGR
jgi:hypothetical protein